VRIDLLKRAGLDLVQYGICRGRSDNQIIYF
jgi:hypothetical protein